MAPSAGRSGSRPCGIRVTPLVVAALLIAGGPASHMAAAADGARSPASPPAGPADSLRLILPEDLARALADSTARRPVVLQVGFKVLFRTGHVAGSRFVGPGSRPDGLSALRDSLRGIPRAHGLVLYCGCCPWNDCPNVQPAFRTARAMGFEDVRVLYIARNLQRDWIEQGLPTTVGDKRPAAR